MSKTLRILLKIIKKFEIEEIKNLMNYGLTLKESLYFQPFNTTS